MELLNRVDFANHVYRLYSLNLLSDLVHVINILTRFPAFATRLSPIALMVASRTLAAHDIDRVVRIDNIARLDNLR